MLIKDVRKRIKAKENEKDVEHVDTILNVENQKEFLINTIESTLINFEEEESQRKAKL